MSRFIFFFVMISLLLGSCSSQASSTPIETLATAALPKAASQTPAAALPASTFLSAPTRTPSPVPGVTSLAEPAAASTPLDASGEAGAGSIGDDYMPELGNTGYDVQRYTLHLDLQPAEHLLFAQVKVEAVSTLDQLEQLSLDFIGFEVEEVLADDKPVNFLRPEAKLVVELPEPLPLGEPFQLQITYRGSPTAERSPYVPFVPHLGLFFIEDDHLFVVAEPDGARYWFPSNDHPRDKALFRFELAVPSGLVGVANGELVDTRLDARSSLNGSRPADLYIWEHNYPMATYLATIAVGNYVRVEGLSPAGVPLRHYVFPDLKGTYERLQPEIGQMVDWLAEMFGPYPFEAFGYVTVLGLPGALETQTLVVIDRSAATNEGTLIHEMAHTWFGNWVSLDSWADIWRNEGFATYLTAMWEAHTTGKDLDEMIARYAEMMEYTVWTDPLGRPSPAEMFGSASYLQGAVFAHALRRELGDQVFFSGLRTYFERFGGADASREEFKLVFEEASGRDLDSIFAEWLESQSSVR